MPRRLKAVLKGQKGVQPGISKVYLIKWPVSVYIHIYLTIYIYTLPKKYWVKYNPVLGKIWMNPVVGLLPRRLG